MWNTVKELLDAIKAEEYVFLRNTNEINENFSETDDWDILCSDINAFVSKINAKSLNQKNAEEKVYNYYTTVNNKRLLIDIREIGDGYYDAAWEQDMLNRKAEYKDYYILDDENQKYSVLYHCLFQKRSDKVAKYKDYITDNFSVWDIQYNIKQLVEFMRIHQYSYVKPKDSWVYLNDENIKLLKEILNG